MTTLLLWAIGALLLTVILIAWFKPDPHEIREEHEDWNTKLLTHPAEIQRKHRGSSHPKHLRD